MVLEVFSALLFFSAYSFFDEIGTLGINSPLDKIML
jgi:hypothetical protein